jgi:hypothetical protein
MLFLALQVLALLLAAPGAVAFAPHLVTLQPRLSRSSAPPLEPRRRSLPVCRPRGWLRAVTASDLAAMRDALALAARSKPGATAPNPRVGCVVTLPPQDGGSGGGGGAPGRRGVGWHPKAGWPHAEVS